MATSLPNPPLPISSLLAPTSAASILARIIGELETLGIQASLWPEEGVALSIVTVLAAILAGFWANFCTAISAGFLPTASGGWLTWLAKYMYACDRTPATYASGSITLVNGGGGLFTFGPGEATFQCSASKATYTNLDPISLSPGPGTSASVQIVATVPGTAGNAQPGQVDTIVSTMNQVGVSNAAPVLGIDEQSDESLRLLCWNSIAANSPFGPRQSFGYAVQTARNSITGTPVNINRYNLDYSAAHQGILGVWLASPEGTAISSDVAGVANNIEAIARPPNVTIYTGGSYGPLSCTAVVDSDRLDVYVTGTPGLTGAPVAAAMEAAISTFFASYPIGGRTAGGQTGLFASSVIGVVQGAWPGVFDVVGATPLIALSPGQVAVNSTTVNVHIV